jgi:predicted nucleotidyltransferase
MKEWKEYLDEVIDPEDVQIKGMSVKDELDPVFWDRNNKLKDYIAEHFYIIAKNFFKNLELDWKTVKDVILTGSLANYNWSKYSDIDLHILVDFRDIDENEKLVKDFFRNATIIWNKVHNITAKGHLIELYIQDSKEPHHSTGIYSIKYDRWNKMPSKYSPEIDYANVKKKSAKLMNEIDEIYELFAEKDYKGAHEDAEKLKERIRKFRQAGLETGGQYSVENLVFKLLRRNDYLQKLSSLKILSYDSWMSVNGGISSEIIKINLKENKERAII